MGVVDEGVDAACDACVSNDPFGSVEGWLGVRFGV
jgi:hypothetical protein